MKKRIMCALLSVLTMLMCMPITNVTTVFASERYDADAALNYAAEHWNDGSEKCAGFVSNCIEAAGIDCWSRSANSLRAQLLNSDLVEEYEVDFNGYINTDWIPEIAPGDIIYFYCEDCSDGLPLIHTVLYRDEVDGLGRCYSHNNANSASNPYYYSTRCWACGGDVSKILVQHFKNSSSNHLPEGCIDLVQGGAGEIRVAGWSFDPNSLHTPVELHVYNGGPAGEGEGHSGIFASNPGRDDLTSVFDIPSGNYGFDSTISTDLRGEQEVYIYAIDNENPDESVFLGSETVFIEDIEESERDDDSFDISFDCGDSISLTQNQEYDISFSFIGNGIYTIGFDNQSECVTPIAWLDTDYSIGRSGIRVRGNKAGKSSFTVNLLNDKKEILYSKTISIHVEENEKTVNEQNHLPEGCIDLVQGGAGEIRVAGWSFDPNSLHTPVELHVYNGGPAGEGEGHSGIFASNPGREDLVPIFDIPSGNYGFDSTISTDLRGEQEVYIYAIDNENPDESVFLGSETVFIEDIEESESNADSFDINEPSDDNSNTNNKSESTDYSSSRYSKAKSIAKELYQHYKGSGDSKKFVKWLVKKALQLRGYSDFADEILNQL